jgi:glycosyltransferase involved in cell wall biosynthesis
MNVVHILWSGQVGGIERVAYDLAQAQQCLGLHPQWLLGSAGGLFQQQASAAGIPVTSLGLGTARQTGLTNWRVAWRLARRADVLHFHGFTAALAALGLLSRRPIIYTEHGNFGFGRKRGLREQVKDTAKGAFLRRVAAVTANSQFSAGVARQRYHLGARGIRVVYNGLDLHHFMQPGNGDRVRHEQRLRDETFCVGTVCRLVGFKRVDRLIRAFAQLLTLRPDSTLLIAGDGPEQPQLLQQIATLGIAAQVRLLGARTDVVDLLAALDAFVLPSQREPFGMSALEAMAQARPVLAFADAGGLLEVILQAGPGLVAADEAALAVRLAQLADDPALRRRLGRQARAVAMTLSIEQMARQMLAIYQEVLAA